MYLAVVCLFIPHSSKQKKSLLDEVFHGTPCKVFHTLYVGIGGQYVNVRDVLAILLLLVILGIFLLRKYYFAKKRRVVYINGKVK